MYLINVEFKQIFNIILILLIMKMYFHLFEPLTPPLRIDLKHM